MNDFRLRGLVALAIILLTGLFNANAQTQSLLLPVPGATSPTGPCTMINFSDNANPVVTDFPSHRFYLSQEEGNPHEEVDLHNSEPDDWANGLYRFDEVYLGQHPMFAQTVVHDADGNLLFFIVDNNIYNRYGEAMIDV